MMDSAAVKISELYKLKGINSIRILPNNKSVFPTEEKFREFFYGRLNDRGGIYHFPNRMMNCDENTLVLFQYDGMIRAIGLLIEAKKTAVVDEKGILYAGYYKFDLPSLKYLNKPISKQMLQKVYPSFKNFNQSKQEIPLNVLDSLLEVIENLCEKTMNEKEQLINYINKVSSDKKLEKVEQESLIKTRLNQGYFRTLLLERYKTCCLCGVQDEHLLVASHIKPWRVCSTDEKLNVDNGFLLCPNHDRLFDQGFISFDEKGAILISNSLSNSDAVFLNIHDDLKVNITEGNKEFLEYHRKNVYKNNR